MPVKAGYLFLAGGGAVAVWSGVKGKRVTDVFRTLIGGDSPATLPQAYNVAGVTPPAASGSTGLFGGISVPGVTGSTPAAGVGPIAPSGSFQQYAFSLFPRYGWGSDQKAPLVSLWNGESGWDPTAYNPGRHTTSPDDTHAFGIPQALPGSKMASAGSDWRTNGYTQVRWGLQYIHDAYGTPANAYMTWLSRSPHWY